LTAPSLPLSALLIKSQLLVQLCNSHREYRYPVMKKKLTWTNVSIQNNDIIETSFSSRKCFKRTIQWTRFGEFTYLFRLTTTFFDQICSNLDRMLMRAKMETYYLNFFSHALLRIYSPYLTIFLFSIFFTNSRLRVIFWLLIYTSSFGFLASFSVGFFGKSLTLSEIWVHEHYKIWNNERKNALSKKFKIVIFYVLTLRMPFLRFFSIYYLWIITSNYFEPFYAQLKIFSKKNEQCTSYKSIVLEVEIWFLGNR